MADAKTGSQAAAKTTASQAAAPKATKAAPKAAATKEASGNAKGPKHTPRTPKPRGRRKSGPLPFTGRRLSFRAQASSVASGFAGYCPPRAE